MDTPAPRRSILLVEDDPVTAKLNARLLEKLGYKVETVSTGESAVNAALSGDEIDLILMDIDLGSGMDGTEAARRILSQREIPLVFLSSHVEADIIDRTKDITSYGYVVKNTGKSVLGVSVSTALNLADARKALMSTTEKLTAVLTAMPDLLFEVDSRGLILDFYSTRSDLLYLPPAEFLGRTMEDVLPPQAAAVLMASIATAQKDGYAAGGLYELPLPGGAHWFEVSSSRKGGDSPAPHFVLLVRDVTERVTSENRYRTLVENIPDIVYRYSLRRGALYWSPRVTSLLGFTTGDLMADPQIWHNSIHPEDVAEVDRVLSGFVPGSNYSLEYRIRSRSGEWHWFLDQSTGSVDVDGDVIVEGCATDITKMKESEKRFLEQSQLTVKFESLSNLAGGLAHDFNNLLGGIFGNLEVARAFSSDPQINVCLDRASDCIGRARNLTRQLMQFSSGGQSLKKNTDLNALVEETVNFTLSGCGVVADLKLAPELWPSCVDPGQIGQVLENLVLNARQAMDHSGVLTVVTENLSFAPEAFPLLRDGPYVRISVRDQGPGILPENLRRVFEPYFTTKPLGHGLGLATSYNLVKQNQGVLEVLSVPGEGAEFNIYLPAVPGLKPALESFEAPDHRSQGDFIILEDEDTLRGIVEGHLASFGYSPQGFSRGHEVLEYALQHRERKPAGILLDLTLPGGMGGLEVASALKVCWGDAPMYAMTGHEAHILFKNPAQGGFRACLLKPFRKSDLARVLNQNQR